MGKLNERFPYYLAELVLCVTELNYLQRYERNYFVKPSETRFRKTRFCIQEAEKRVLRIMHFSEKVHLISKTCIRWEKSEYAIFQVWDIIGQAIKVE